MSKFKVNTHKGKSFQLDDNNEIHRGGEGRILLLPSQKDVVAKVYHQGITPISLQRFEQLQKLDSGLFVKPLDLLLVNKQIIGFLMEYAGNEYFPLSSLFNRSFCQRNGVDSKFKTTIAEKLIEVLKQAHFNGFVIGDLNQFNVLVSLSGNMKLIDVDSYQTPGHNHTGLLLEDIRDYYYQGKVSMNSDYFALSVLLFYLFTYTHPFKGIHQKYKTIAERMVHKLPVFLDDPLLKSPKCYEPIKNKEIQGKFEKIYLGGERFLFSLDGNSVKTIVAKPLLVTKHDEGELVINQVAQNPGIVNVYFGKQLGFIETTDKYTVFSAKNKGYLTKRFELLKKDYDQVFLGNENVLAKKDKSLFYIKENGDSVEITNFKFHDTGFTYRLEDILISISQGHMYWLYLDEVLNSSIRNKRTEVFSEAFVHHNGLVQNTGGISRIFYNTGKDIATVKIDKKIKQLFQRGNVGLIQYVENESVKNEYFKIKGLQIYFSGVGTHGSFEFGYMAATKDDGFVFEPNDNKLVIRRTEDFKVITEIECNKLSNQSSLFSTSSGIVVWEGDWVWLVNKK